MNSEPHEPCSQAEVPDRPYLEQRLELLTRELLELKDLLRTRTEPRPDADYDALIVETAAVRYAIPIERVQEVLPLVWPAPLPGTPPWILGSIHYADEQIPVVDVRHRLLGEPTIWSSSTKLVLARLDTLRALVVDAVEDLVRVHVDGITRAPDDVPHSPFLLGSIRPQAGHIVHLLSLEKTCRELTAPP